MKVFRSLLPVLALLTAPAAIAEDVVGMAKPWQYNFQEAASPVMEQLTHLHDNLTVLIIIISAFVLALMVFIVLRFNARANPVPSKTTHNTFIEIVWTVVPILILLGICIPSFKLHYYMSEPQDPEMTLKVVGYQWYWHYDYPDHGIGFDSYIVEEKDLKEGQPRLLTVDNQVVVPVDTTILVQTTAADVIHAWAVPAFGVKRDAVPGRLNETWFKATKTGVFYGQCSELCGVKHGFMPIAVKVVSKEDFKAWVEEAKARFASNENTAAPLQLAQK
jgi:cytochrome c oxidase subunit II